MKLLKSAALAATLAFSLGLISTPANAICMGMACMYNSMTPLQAIMATELSVDEVMNLVDENADKELILKGIRSTLKATKEINANDKVDRNRMRANKSMKKARKAVKVDDYVSAKEHLVEAKKRYSGLQGMLELSQADRTAQQTSFINRIMDTHDEGTGKR
ncbi:MAG TPA: hypothetical protein EYQ43_05250 [Methyloprofundus sp.]|uniref:hypothetical protein n=1 Tax=Methyloprofundus sp. TaxID=2020875 RepID=UPI001842F16B|nr:hypothetical protein [Methyloprofundus sp.]HIG64960.1 hypothetical protein [Methyloprofundus sp.]HIL79122.1 hypothetical protein [Methylococcales bacterium]